MKEITLSLPIDEKVMICGIFGQQGGIEQHGLGREVNTSVYLLCQANGTIYKLGVVQSVVFWAGTTSIITYRNRTLCSACSSLGSQFQI